MDPPSLKGWVTNDWTANHQFKQLIRSQKKDNRVKNTDTKIGKHISEDFLQDRHERFGFTRDLLQTFSIV